MIFWKMLEIVLSIMANNIMTYAYWDVGKRIVEQELKGATKAKYGSYIISGWHSNYQISMALGFLLPILKIVDSFI